VVILENEKNHEGLQAQRWPSCCKLCCGNWRCRWTVCGKSLEQSMFYS